MRTTLTLDDDVAAMLERLRSRQGLSLRDAVNEGLRLGLPQVFAPTPPAGEFHTRAVSLGGCLLPNLDDIDEVLAIAEGEDYR